ncbi:MAG: Stk1 family PASTA domain-containing Ser/Thr kinase [Clostridiales bacterium]|nr:Stk1 family PASTA domain-containing Ser/Thr kinase [Clostridiales bacterium]
MIGKILGSRYELLEKVGTGGMAIVYKAKCHLLNRNVAVKILKGEYVQDQEFLDKFRKEAQAAASLSHQNIVNIYDVGSEDDIPYIVMELVPGETLKEYIANYEGFLTNEKIADFSKQIALALEHAHSNQIIHRDIKPHNILVSKEGTLKVADFGIASAISETTTSYSSEAIGSVRYSSPEQARGRNVDERTDLYSLGVLMYEMATRKVPFEGDTAVEIALKHMKDDIVAPTEINSMFHKGLESIVIRSLLKNVNQRYQNARELIDDLDKIINNPKENVAFYDFDADDATQKLPSLEAYDIKKGENRTMTKKTTKKPSSKSPVKKQNKNIVAMIGVVLLAFIMVFVIFVFTRLEPDKVTEPDFVEMTNVVGMTIEEATSTLEAIGHEVLIGSSEKNNAVPSGSVSSQSPAAGTKLRPTYKVTLFPSEGSTLAVIPNLIQKQLADAEVELQNSKFDLGAVDYVNDDIDKGFILSQDPAPGTEANDDAVINVVVSLGPEYNLIIVPRLTDLTLEEAQKRILDIGLEVDDITYENHPTIEKDHVITQSVAEGTEVDLEAMISIVISLGTGEEEDPEEGTDEVTDPNVETTKKYNLVAADFIGQDVTVKVLFEKDGITSVIHNQIHPVDVETGGIPVEVTASGKGTLSFFVNDILLNSISVDFSN